MNIESIRHRYLRSVVAPMFRGMGLGAGTAIAGRLARGLSRVETPSRRRAEARLRAALADAGVDQDVDALLAAMYQHQARFWTEALFIPRRLRDKSWRRHVHVEDEAGLRGLAESQRGCVLATAYFGNIAAAACALGQIFRPVHVLVDWLAQPSLASWQRSLYAQPQVQPVDVREAGRVLPRVLSGGGAVFMVCEHERQRARGVSTRFLGRDLNFAPTLGRLARWFDVPIGVITCRRNPRLFSFNLALHEVVEHAPNSTDDGTVVRQVMAGLNDAIMQSPDQYLWSTPTRQDLECNPAPTLRTDRVRPLPSSRNPSATVLQPPQPPALPGDRPPTRNNTSVAPA